MNLNELAKQITLREGKKVSISIAQVKEVLSITLEELGKYSDDEIMRTIKAYRKQE